MKLLEVKIRTLTPLWTGGVEGTMDRIHETGILGSLRWWYEAIVRGLGGSACDATTHKCSFDVEEYRKSKAPDKRQRLRDAGLCDVCQIFGATGWRRRFRLEGPVWWNEHRNCRLTVKVNNNRGWYLDRGFMGEGELRLRTLRLPEGWTEDDLWQTLLLTSRLIARWGGLGPKTQQGDGVVQMFHNLELDVNSAIEAIQRLQQCKKRRANENPSDVPSIDGFFFTKIRFPLSDPNGWLANQTSHLNPDNEFEWYLQQGETKPPVVPLAPVVRYHLRQLIKRAHNPQNRWIFSHAARHHLVGEQGRKSLIHVSHAYPVDSGQWEFRIWGWIPDTLPGGVTRTTIFKHLRQWLGVTQERQWHHANINSTTLWNSDRLNLTDVQVCWFAKQKDEGTNNYLKALLEGYQEQESCRDMGSTESKSLCIPAVPK